MLVLDDIYPAMIAISILGRHIICNRYHMADMHHKIFPPTRFPIRRSTQDPGRRSDILHPVTGYLNEPQEVQTWISRCVKLHALNYHCNIWDNWFSNMNFLKIENNIKYHFKGSGIITYLGPFSLSTGCIRSKCKCFICFQKWTILESHCVK